METNRKKTLKATSLELRHILEGEYDQQGNWQPGDLERRLNSLGVWNDRPSKPLEEMGYLSPQDQTARCVVDAFIEFRAEAGVSQENAFAEFVREAAYSWANRLLALRCMEARGIIDEVILQKDTYGGRSLVHSRLARREPELCLGDDDGLFEVLSREFKERAEELPGVFDPAARSVVLRPSIASLKECVQLLSGIKRLSGQEPATDEVFQAQDAFGWAYQYWNAEEKDRVFEMVRKQRGKKIEGADIIPATQLYTEPYMVKFLVQNSLGATWLGMHPESGLAANWEYFVEDVDRAAVEPKPVKEITFLDPAMGSGHFLLEAFELFYSMYEEEGLDIPEDICAAILNHNLYGIDIDLRAVQIGFAVLWMKAKEKAPELEPETLTTFHEHLVATNIRLPKGKNHLEEFLARYPEDLPLEEALETVFKGLENAPELGSLLQIEEPVKKKLKELKEQAEFIKREEKQLELIEVPSSQQGVLPFDAEEFSVWKDRTLKRLKKHFDKEAESADYIQNFFGKSATQGLSLFELLSNKYDVVAANPPYLGSKKLSRPLKLLLASMYPSGRNDLFGMFFERMAQLRNLTGTLAFVSSSSFLWLQLHAELREFIIQNLQPSLAVHLGHYAFEELRDHVNAILWISHGKPVKGRWIRLVDCFPKSSFLKDRNTLDDKSRNFILQLRDFEVIPGEPFLYWMLSSLSSIFSSATLLEEVYPAKIGLQTCGIPRFVRSWWENSTFNSRWVPYVKGGETTRWLEGDTYAVDWQDEGTRIKEVVKSRYGSISRKVSNQDSYFQSGITFSLSSGKEIAVRLLPEGYIFDLSSPTIICDKNDSFWCLAYLNSLPIRQIISALNPTMHFTSEDVKRVPVNKKVEDIVPQLEAKARLAVNIQEKILSLNLTSIKYVGFSSNEPNIDDLLSRKREKAITLINELEANQREIDLLVSKIFDWDMNTALPTEELDDESDASEDEADKHGLYIEENDRDEDELSLFFEDHAYAIQVASQILLLLSGFNWPQRKTLGSLIRKAKFESEDGIIALATQAQKKNFETNLQNTFDINFPAIDWLNFKAKFKQLLKVSVGNWLQNSFFEGHVVQFKKRPIVWQIRSSKRDRRNLSIKSAFEAFFLYFKLDKDLLPRLSSHYVGIVLKGFEAELRVLEKTIPEQRTEDQAARVPLLEDWVEELKAFSQKLNEISVSGFGSEKLHPKLRQYAIDDATLHLKALWLSKLEAFYHANYLADWQQAAADTKLHDDLPQWIEEALEHLDYACSIIGSKPPKESDLKTDPVSADLANHICKAAGKMVKQSLQTICKRWMEPFNEIVLAPLKEERKQLQTEQTELKQELAELLPSYSGDRRSAIVVRLDFLKAQIKSLNAEIKYLQTKAKKLREGIEKYECPEAHSWEPWLAQQPLYDAISSLDGKRTPPHTIAEFVAQESTYTPDLNDGVRVNIAPLQKAGILACDVLSPKDVDDAIADRAEWRSDERRWCREGKLPHPGWWGVPEA